MRIKSLKKILDILKPSEYSLDKELIKKYSIDWRGVYQGSSDLIIFPKSVKNICKIMSLCQKHNIPLVPQGGNTGLVGGGVPRKNKNEIILNLSKLNRIRDIDLVGKSITIESGCILENIRTRLQKLNLEFPLSMGSRGNCQIGGNIATNAGGVNVIKYGTIRKNILGIEAVLPDGTIYNSLKNIKKNNTGLDLKQILIGSEGILGVITAATVQVFPKPQEKIVIWASFKCFNDVLEFYMQMTDNFYDLITSFEFMNKESIEILEKNEMNLDGLNKNECYCLVEISNFLKINDFQNFITSNIDFTNLTTKDIIVSKSESENAKLWSYRESIPLAEKKENFIIAHDVSIPLNMMNKFVKKTTKEIKKFEKHTRIINFGHLGDNNLHFNVLVTSYNSNTKKSFIRSINRIVFNNVNHFRGAISAEHGIGQLRRNELKLFKNRDELEKMKILKKAFDPMNILNPGKVL